MDVRILPARLSGTVRAVPSKSQAHRALICAALADAPTRVGCGSESGDMAATVACLRALGAEIARDSAGYDVTPLKRIQTDAVANLPCGESGSTFRFLLPIAGALGRKAAFFPQGRLPNRPLSPLYEELTSHGLALSPQGSVPFITEGRLVPGRYALDGGVSSQFVSGLLFALPLLDEDSELRLSGQIESLPYIGMTLAMLERFGIYSAFDGASFSIRGGQTYRSPGNIDVEGDWSNAAFWLCAGALGKSVACTGLDLRSRQGDRALLDILKRFGARVEANEAAVSVAPGELSGIELDARDIPDLVPIIAVVAAAANGATVIRNAGRLRLKESDRLSTVTELMRSLGADIAETEDGLTIRGGCALTGTEVSSWGDHRIAMAAAIAANLCDGPIVIRGAEAVNKSYPGFFEDLRALGGEAEIR